VLAGDQRPHLGCGVCARSHLQLGQSFLDRLDELVTNAAREAARSGIIDGSTNSTVSTVAKSFLQSAAGVAPGDVTVNIAVSGSSAGGQVANANARALQVAQDGHRAPQFRGDRTHDFNGAPVLLVGTVREVDAGHIEARLHERAQRLWR
jgi:hypothetical protein